MSREHQNWCSLFFFLRANYLEPRIFLSTRISVLSIGSAQKPFIIQLQELTPNYLQCAMNNKMFAITNTIEMAMASPAKKSNFFSER